MLDYLMSRDLLSHSKDIVCAYISKHSIAQHEIMDMFNDIYTKLKAIANHDAQTEQKQTIYEDYLICLEDGKRLKTLKRHLHKTYGLTPEQYRKKWNLPADYPMVAPNYSNKRKHIAKQNNFGKLDN